MKRDRFDAIQKLLRDAAQEAQANGDELASASTEAVLWLMDLAWSVTQQAGPIDVSSAAQQPGDVVALPANKTATPTPDVAASASFEERIADEVRRRVRAEEGVAIRDLNLSLARSDHAAKNAEIFRLMSRLTTAEFNAEKIAKDWSDDRNANIVEKDHLNTQLSAKYAEIARLKAQVADEASRALANAALVDQGVGKMREQQAEIARLTKERDHNYEQWNDWRRQCHAVTADRDALKAALDAARGER